jgi:hypothetical protein
VSGFGGILTKNRRNITVIQNKAKCRSKKKYLERDFAAGVLSVCGLLPSYDPILHPPPLHIVYVYPVYLFTQGRGVGELTRKKVRGAIVHKAGRKYQHDGLYL